MIGHNISVRSPRLEACQLLDKQDTQLLLW